LYLFATHKVWDTEHNSGVLAYVNLCEHNLEIIADRGIDQKAHMDDWQNMCDDAVAQFRQGKMQIGLTTLITQ
ncbi:TPM domain-containing protein, partial [Streptococcus pneumoniae]